MVFTLNVEPNMLLCTYDSHLIHAPYKFHLHPISVGYKTGAQIFHQPLHRAIVAHYSTIVELYHKTAVIHKLIQSLDCSFFDSGTGRD